MKDGAWLVDFAARASATDRLAESAQHSSLLAAGLLGEAGSILAELKKERRDQNAYPVYRKRMAEEIGDFLWYYVRLVSLTAPDLVARLDVSSAPAAPSTPSELSTFLEFGSAVGEVLEAVATSRPSRTSLLELLSRVWRLLRAVADATAVDLEAAAKANAQKNQSRWPAERTYAPLFDDDFPQGEQLPRHLELEFLENSHGEQRVVSLRCNGINFGDRLTDNIEDPDGYRYHDVFHFAHAVHLGWSPVVRALLRAKRKSISKVDEGQDGARAVILEEAVAAVVYSRAKELSFFEGIDELDYDLLKTVREFIRGYEVDMIPLWQWEAAILDGYRVFRLLRANSGGTVTLDLKQRRLTYGPPSSLTSSS